jgi:hypothetical protein
MEQLALGVGRPRHLLSLRVANQHLIVEQICFVESRIKETGYDRRMANGTLNCMCWDLQACRA